MINRFGTLLTILIFLSIIYFPLINKNFRLVRDIPNTENRKLARQPKLNIKSLADYPLKFESYYNDRFTIRSIMLKWYNKYHVCVLQKSPLPEKLVIGKNNWLFMQETYMDAYTGKDSLTVTELEQLKKEFEYRANYLNKRNCKFYLMIMPSKATIYHDYLPSTIYQFNKRSWGESLNDYLAEHSDIKLVDVFTEFKNYSGTPPLYYKTDTHINGWGGFIAANALLKELNKIDSTIKPLVLDNYIIKKSPKINGNISDLLGKVKNFDDYVYDFTPKFGFSGIEVTRGGYPCIEGFPYCHDFEHRKEIKNSNAPRILIITDSFGNYLFPYVGERFSRTEMIFDAWQYKLNEAIVEQEKPDIFLMVVLEGNLRNILENLSPSSLNLPK